MPRKWMKLINKAATLVYLFSLFRLKLQSLASMYFIKENEKQLHLSEGDQFKGSTTEKIER